MLRVAKRVGLGVALMAVVGFSFGCVGAMGPTFGIWSDVKGPIQGGSGSGSKTGEACAQHWLGIVALGDASIETAAANGGITRVDSVDYTMKNQIVIGEFCTVVRGS
ncbi:MAG: TRL-like family protein [Proteobacteria bacterium]|nr:TRL-like family protein [Pseudomonadota bacterium]